MVKKGENKGNIQLWLMYSARLSRRALASLMQKRHKINISFLGFLSVLGGRSWVPGLKILVSGLMGSKKIESFHGFSSSDDNVAKKETFEYEFTDEHCDLGEYCEGEHSYNRECLRYLRRRNDSFCASPSTRSEKTVEEKPPPPPLSPGRGSKTLIPNAEVDQPPTKSRGGGFEGVHVGDLKV
ncbi:hypothetical protein SOVF_018730 [Spinacia oleracea]|nr:hypothetical protein SOVF_018730 [Spinacia oleracea]